MAWTDERIDTLKRMWEAGQTASQIAEALGGVSRNAVIGKAHRLNLQARPSPVRPNDPDNSESARTPRGAAVAVDGVIVPVSSPVATSTAFSPPVPTPAPVTAPAIVHDSTPTPPLAAAHDVQPSATGSDREAGDLNDEDELDANAALIGGGSADGVIDDAAEPAPVAPPAPIMRSVGPGGFLRQAPGEQQAPITPAPPRRLVPAKPSADMSGKTGLLDLNDKICKWPIGHPGEPDFHFCGERVNPGFPYCVGHCGHAYQAQLPRRDRRPPPPLPFGGPRVR